MSVFLLNRDPGWHAPPLVLRTGWTVFWYPNELTCTDATLIPVWAPPLAGGGRVPCCSCRPGGPDLSKNKHPQLDPDSNAISRSVTDNRGLIYFQRLSEFRAWINSCQNGFMWGVIAHSCLSYNHSWSYYMMSNYVPSFYVEVFACPWNNLCADLANLCLWTRLQEPMSQHRGDVSAKTHAIPKDLRSQKHSDWPPSDIDVKL